MAHAGDKREQLRIENAVIDHGGNLAATTAAAKKQNYCVWLNCGALNEAMASWSAVAERSGDTAFARTRVYLDSEIFRSHESGVALGANSAAPSAHARLDSGGRQE